VPSYADRNSASTLIEGMLEPMIQVTVPAAVAGMAVAVGEDMVVAAAAAAHHDAETVPTVQVVPESLSRSLIVPMVVADFALVEANSVANPAAVNQVVDVAKVARRNGTAIDFPLIPARAKWHESK
jgi:hypothetical protein